MKIKPENRRQIMTMLREHFSELAQVPESSIASVARKGDKLFVHLLIRRRLKIYELKIKHQPVEDDRS